MWKEPNVLLSLYSFLPRGGVKKPKQNFRIIIFYLDTQIKCTKIKLGSMKLFSLNYFVKFYLKAVFFLLARWSGMPSV